MNAALLTTVFADGSPEAEFVSVYLQLLLINFDARAYSPLQNEFCNGPIQGSIRGGIPSF